MANRVLLPDTKLTALQAAAAAGTPQWAAFKARLDANLNQMLSHGAYQGSWLSWIADYALGWQITGNPDYADKAIAVLKSAIREYQKGDWGTRQFIARGDGTTKTFALPHSDVLTDTVLVYLGDVQTIAVVHGAVDGPDAGGFYSKFLKVSNTSDGPVDYVEGVDWFRSGNDWPPDINWSLHGKEPAVGATYYITETSGFGAPGAPYTLANNAVTLATAPGPDKAVFVEYIYGKRATDYSTLAYQQTSVGDGGFKSIYVDDSYTSRYLGKYVSIGLDWLSNYPGLTLALKAEAADLLVRWNDYVRDHGYMRGYPSSNYEAGAWCSRVLTAVALKNAGDANAARLAGEMTAYRTANVVPTLTGADTSLKGGFWAEGWSYGALATENLLNAALAGEQAGFWTATEERHWSTEAITQLVTAQPTPTTVYDGGDWFAYPAPFPAKDLFYLLAAMADDPTAKAWANRVIQTYPGQQTSDWQDLLYRDPAAAIADWTATAPLTYRSLGAGLICARADWSYGSPFVAFQLGNPVGADHQSFTPGQLEISRGADNLLVNAAVVLDDQSGAPKSAKGNVVIVDDNGDGLQNYRFAMGYEYGTPGAQITAYEAMSDHVYVAGDYRAAYSLNTNPGNGGAATKLTRQVVYLRPGIVVVRDRVGTVKDVYPKWQQWNLLAPPTVSGNSWQVTVGGSKLYAQTFSASQITTVSSNPFGPNVWTVRTQNATPTTDVNYATVFQVMPAGGSPVSVQWAAGTNGTETVTVGNYTITFGSDGISATILTGGGSMVNNGTETLTANPTSPSPNNGVVNSPVWTVDNAALLTLAPAGLTCKITGKGVSGTATVTFAATNSTGAAITPATKTITLTDPPLPPVTGVTITEGP